MRKILKITCITILILVILLLMIRAILQNTAGKETAEESQNTDQETGESEESLDAYEEPKEISLTIESPELISLINQNWSKRAVSSMNVTIVYDKVFNLIFDETYTGNIVNGIDTKTSYEEVKRILGTPQFQDTEFTSVFGYKSKDIYIFFAEGQISIYRVEKDDGSEAFRELVEKFEEDRNLKSFVSGVTDIWPDYDWYAYDTDYVDLHYILRGIKIQFGITKENGIQIYSNYVDKDALQKTFNTNDFYFLMNKNFIFETEKMRFFHD